MHLEHHHRLLLFFCTDRWFGTVPSVDTPFGYLAVLLRSDSQQLPAWPQASELFFDQVFHRPDLNARFRKHFLQFRILSFQLLQLGNIRGLHAAILRLPIIEGCIANADLTAYFFNRYTGFLLLDSSNNLAFCKSLFHVSKV